MEKMVKVIRWDFTLGGYKLGCSNEEMTEKEFWEFFHANKESFEYINLSWYMVEDEKITNPKELDFGANGIRYQAMFERNVWEARQYEKVAK